ncbi:MAG: hypothetical protein CL678_01530 [Bdellovibrionaceae bacterium]|nr:hypothetical protein [Pseudobdellovibrionaceae bacterium]|tara:strand:- start:7078 stop:7554 length:477 start_codon:yes stop_codon:yes gene_type:complete
MDLEKKPRKWSAYESALGLLARREHSLLELKTKLKQKGYEKSEIQEAVEKAVLRGEVSEERFKRSRVRELIRRNFGFRYIVQDLSSKGVSLDAEAFEEIAEAMEDQRESPFEVYWRKIFQHEFVPDPKLENRFLRTAVRKGFEFSEAKKFLEMKRQNQ